MNGSQKRTRLERVAALELPPGLVERTWDYLQRGDVLVRLGLCVAAVVGLWLVTAAWSIPLGYKRNYTPPRDIVANVKFKKADHDQTMAAKTLAARKVTYIYDHDKEPLVQLRAGLQNSVVIVAGAKSLSELDKKGWLEFFPQPPPATAQSVTPVTPVTAEEEERQFRVFHDALSTPEALAKLERAVAESFAPAEQHGLIDKLAQDPTEGNQQEIVVLTKGDPNRPQIVKVSDVLIGEADWLKKGLAERLDSPEVAERIFTWLRRRLPSTLVLDREATNHAKEAAVAAVEEQFVQINPGESLVKAGHPLSEQDLALLTLEHDAYLDQVGWRERLAYSLATMGMLVALAVLCGAYVLHYERRLLDSLRRLAITLALVVITVGLAVMASGDNLRAELVPLVVFGMTLSIAYHRDMALLFTAAATLVVVVVTGQDLSAFMILYATAAAAILMVGSIRNRRKLIYVGALVGVVALLTTVGVETIGAQPWATIRPEARDYALWSMFAGLLMLGLLPFIESLFGVQTELSLLELGDVAHPLLQELVRRAPGTYNHSINVASIAEAAAEAIGAKGLVGARGGLLPRHRQDAQARLFRRKPGARQPPRVARAGHEHADHHRPHQGRRRPGPPASPAPADHRLHRAASRHDAGRILLSPRQRAERIGPRRAGRRRERLPLSGPQAADQGGGRADAGRRGGKRQPGLGRAHAGADREPGRGNRLKRLLDGQFDACGLTLKELATIRESLIKSLTAVYHGRVKYPDQRTA